MAFVFQFTLKSLSCCDPVKLDQAIFLAENVYCFNVIGMRFHGLVHTGHLNTQNTFGWFSFNCGCNLLTPVVILLKKDCPLEMTVHYN